MKERKTTRGYARQQRRAVCQHYTTTDDGKGVRLSSWTDRGTHTVVFAPDVKAAAALLGVKYKEDV